MVYIKWIFKAWPILIPLIFICFHVFVGFYFCLDLKQTNKLISLILQVIGGLLVLYSIDSNLGLFGHVSLGALAIKWIKSFPLKGNPTTLDFEPVNTSSFVHPIKLRTGGPGKTTEDHLAYLQKQINWLKEDHKEDLLLLKQKNEILESYLRQQLLALRSTIGVVDQKITEASVGGIEWQIFGLLLMIYGAVVSYFT